MNTKRGVRESQITAWVALGICVSLFGCSRQPRVDPPGTFTFYDTEVTGYSKLKEGGGGYEFWLMTKVTSIDRIRNSIEAKADPTWSTEGWTAGENSPQNDVDIIRYTKGPSKLSISIQAAKEEKDRKRYVIGYTYRPSISETQQE